LKEIYSSVRNNYKNEKIYYSDYSNSKELLNRKLQKNQRTIVIASLVAFSEENLLENEKKLVIDNKNMIHIILIYENEILKNEPWVINLITTAKITLISSQNIASSLEDTVCNLIDTSNLGEFQAKVDKKAGFHFNTKDDCILYMYNQIIFELFEFDMLSTQQSKADLISFCVEKIHDNRDELKEFTKDLEEDRFKDEHAIWWYTRNSFFYELINNVIRIHDFLDIFRIRYAIIQLRNSLKGYELRKENFPPELFRAALINEVELKLFLEATEAKAKKIIQFRGFTSTTKKLDVAKIFAIINYHKINKQETNLKNDSDIKLLSVIYRIKVDKSYDGIQMFDIQHASAIEQEDEILLNYSCFVQIISVTKSEEYNIDYYVDCIFSNFDEIKETIDNEILEIKEIFVDKKKEKIDNFYLAKFLVKIKKAGHLKDLLDMTTCINPSDEADRLNFLGLMSHSKSQFDDALTCYEKSLEIRQKVLVNRNEGDDENNNDNIEIAKIYKNMAYILKNKNRNEEAFEYFKICLEILKDKSDKNITLLTEIILYKI